MHNQSKLPTLKTKKFATTLMSLLVASTVISGCGIDTGVPIDSPQKTQKVARQTASNAIDFVFAQDDFSDPYFRVENPSKETLERIEKVQNAYNANPRKKDEAEKMLNALDADQLWDMLECLGAQKIDYTDHINFDSMTNAEIYNLVSTIASNRHLINIKTGDKNNAKIANYTLNDKGVAHITVNKNSLKYTILNNITNGTDDIALDVNISGVKIDGKKLLETINAHNEKTEKAS